MGFKLLTSTPYYAQANGQVEAANKVVISLIKKHVGKKPRKWHKTLDQVLWACRNSLKEATGTTLFRLTQLTHSSSSPNIMQMGSHFAFEFELTADEFPLVKQHHGQMLVGKAWC